MRNGLIVLLSAAAVVFFGCLDAFAAPPLDARELIKAAINYWRDTASFAEASMKIHRPDWERQSELMAWTKGEELSLVRFTAPPKDAGNATLTVEDDVWTFTPKTNRIIKIPPSMKSQSWMGSDFSYQDLSKDDEIIDSYAHRLIGEERHEGQKVRIVESVPFESAPIVWGKEVLWIRDDFIILKHGFFDQDGKLVKELVAREIGLIGGKLYGTRVRMTKMDAPEEWTEVHYREAKFGIDLPDSFFTLSNLRNPRQ